MLSWPWARDGTETKLLMRKCDLGSVCWRGPPFLHGPLRRDFIGKLEKGHRQNLTGKPEVLSTIVILSSQKSQKSGRDFEQQGSTEEEPDWLLEVLHSEDDNNGHGW